MKQTAFPSGKDIGQNIRGAHFAKTAHKVNNVFFGRGITCWELLDSRSSYPSPPCHLALQRGFTSVAGRGEPRSGGVRVK